MFRPKDRGLRRKLVAVALVFVFVLLSSVAVGVTVWSLSNRATQVSAPDRRAAYGLRNPGFVMGQTNVMSPRDQRALSWLNGLASGLITPTDVTGRLHQQDPKLARMVMTAWGDLRGL